MIYFSMDLIGVGGSRGSRTLVQNSIETNMLRNVVCFCTVS